MTYRFSQGPSSSFKYAPSSILSILARAAARSRCAASNIRTALSIAAYAPSNVGVGGFGSGKGGRCCASLNGSIRSASRPVSRASVATLRASVSARCANLSGVAGLWSRNCQPSTLNAASVPYGRAGVSQNSLQSHRRLPQAVSAGQTPSVSSPTAAPRISCSSRAGSRALGQLRGVASGKPGGVAPLSSVQGGQGAPVSSASARASSHASINRPAVSPIFSMVRACHAAGEGSCQTIPGSLTR